MTGRGFFSFFGMKRDEFGPRYGLVMVAARGFPAWREEAKA
jgi:hypothetical protein